MVINQFKGTGFPCGYVKMENPVPAQRLMPDAMDLDHVIGPVAPMKTKRTHFAAVIMAEHLNGLVDLFKLLGSLFSVIKYTLL